MRKLLLIIPAILLLSASCNPLTQQANTNTKVASTKIFTDSKLELQFSYPEDWQVKTGYYEEIKQTDIDFTSASPKSLVTSRLVGITVFTTTEDLATFMDDSCSVGNCNLYKRGEDITVGGAVGKKVVNPPSPVPSQAVYVRQGGNVFIFHVISDGETSEDYTLGQMEIFNQILNSVKFTK